MSHRFMYDDVAETNYLKLCNKMQSLPIIKKFERNTLMRGNLAFMVDRCTNDNNMENNESDINQLENLLDSKDTNKFCEKVLDLIYKYYDKECDETKRDGFVEDIYKISKKICAEDKNLSNFVLIGPDEFPDWFLRIESILQNEKNKK